MKIDFNQFQSEVNTLASEKRDYLVNPNLHSTVDATGELRIALTSNDKPTEICGFSDHGRKSYLGRMGLKDAVWSKLGVGTKRAVNEDLTRSLGKPLFFRTHKDVVRFAGSDQYDVYDNKLAVERILPMFDKLKFRGAHIDPDFMQIRATFGDPICVQHHHHFYAGICVQNNEVGQGAFHGSMLIYDEVCRNGMIVNGIQLFHGSIIHLKNRNKEDKIDFEHIVDVFQQTKTRLTTALEHATDNRLNFLDEDFKQKFIERCASRGVNKRFVEPLAFGERPLLDVVSDITRRSQELDYGHRLNADTLAGELLLSAA